MTPRPDRWYLLTTLVMVLAIAASLPLSRLARLVWLVGAIGAVTLIARALHLARRRREEADQDIVARTTGRLGHDVRNAMMPVLEAVAAVDDPELRAEAEAGIRRAIAAPERLTLDRLHPLQSARHPNRQESR